MLDVSPRDSLTDLIIGAAIVVHKEMGPGLLESTYEACLAYELSSRGIKVEQQKSLPVRYRDVELNCGYRIDMLVDSRVIVELKTVDKLLPIHQAQLITYLKLAECHTGLLINFNELLLRDGIRRMVV
jgi:GxxExxY protein